MFANAMKTGSFLFIAGIAQRAAHIERRPPRPFLHG